MASALPPFPSFNVDDDPTTTGQRWTKWRKRFENFLLAMNVDEPTRKRALLLHYIGPSAFDVFETLSDTGDEKDYKTAMERLNEILPLSAMLNMKSICFVKLVSNRKKNWINLQRDYDNLPHLVSSRLLIKKSSRKSFSAVLLLVCVGVPFVNRPSP